MSTIFLINTVLDLFGFCVCCLTSSAAYAPVYTVGVMGIPNKAYQKFVHELNLFYYDKLYLFYFKTILYCIKIKHNNTNIF